MKIIKQFPSLTAQIVKRFKSNDAKENRLFTKCQINTDLKVYTVYNPDSQRVNLAFFNTAYFAVRENY